jgi:hypothetical protein
MDDGRDATWLETAALLAGWAAWTLVLGLVAWMVLS